MNGLRKPLVLFVGIALASWMPRAVNGEIAWQSELRTAHAKAESEGKLLLLHFYTDNCVWCERLEQGAFQDPSLATAIERDFVAVKIHAGKSPSLAATFKVAKFPTDVIVTTQGEAILHRVPPQSSVDYITMLAQTVDQASSAGLVAQNPASGGAKTTPAVASRGAAGSSTSPTSSGDGKLAARHSVDRDAVARGTTATQVSMRTNPLAAPTDPRTATQSAISSQIAKPELAMDGICAVTVIEKDQCVEGKPEFGVIHLGQLYLFSDQRAMDQFVENPEPYTPVLNGIDVVRFFEERKIVKGNYQFGMKDPEHGRMFFFADEAALNHFYNQHTRYTDAAIAVMTKAIAEANPRR